MTGNNPVFGVKMTTKLKYTSLEQGVFDFSSMVFRDIQFKLQQKWDLDL